MFFTQRRKGAKKTFRNAAALCIFASFREKSSRIQGALRSQLVFGDRDGYRRGYFVGVFSTAISLGRYYHPRIFLRPDIVALLERVPVLSINAQDKQGFTALMHAIKCRVCGSENEMAREVRVLLEGGADVGIKDNQGRTALMLAKQADIKSLISLLEEAERRQ